MIKFNHNHFFKNLLVILHSNRLSRRSSIVSAYNRPLNFLSISYLKMSGKYTQIFIEFHLINISLSDEKFYQWHEFEFTNIRLKNLTDLLHEVYKILYVSQCSVNENTLTNKNYNKFPFLFSGPGNSKTVRVIHIFIISHLFSKQNV